MTFTHDEIEAQDLIDRYVRGQLDAATSDAVEEHYFGCDICFAQVTELEALRGAVRDAVATGALTDEGPALAPMVPAPAPVRRPSRIIVWSMAASAMLTVGAGWMAFVQMPALRSQLASAEADRTRLQSALDVAATSAKTTAVPTPPATETNFGLVTLSSERGVEDIPSFTPSTLANRLAIAIDGPASPSGRGRLEFIAPSTTQKLDPVPGLIRGANGLWTITLTVHDWPGGVYRLRLYDDVPNGALLGEYRLKLGPR